MTLTVTLTLIFNLDLFKVNICYQIKNDSLMIEVKLIKSLSDTDTCTDRQIKKKKRNHPNRQVVMIH